MAIKNLTIQRSIAVEKRQEHLTFRQEVLVLDGKKEKAKAVETIKKAEQRARCFRKFQAFTKPPRSSGGIAFTLQPTHEGDFTRIQQPEELATALFHRNRIHFAQADGTPFTRAPLSTALSFSGVTKAGEQILNGTGMPENTPPSAAAILAELKRVRTPLPHHITLSAMIQGFAKWRESTTTSPSNKHLGIYKSLIQHLRYTNEQKKHTKEASRDNEPNTN
jgi:hypothetical protein